MSTWMNKTLTAAMVIGGITLAGAASAANDLFLKMDGIKGESADAKHKGEIEILSWSWGVQQTVARAAGGGAGAGKAVVHDLVIQKVVDASSPVLVGHAFSGRHIPRVELAVRKAGERQTEYIKIVLEDVLVTSVASSGAAQGDRATESVTLNFLKIEYSYTPMGPDGRPGAPVVVKWDVAKNAAQ